MLFFTYTIIEDLVGPVFGHNLEHDFTGCVQRGIVSVRLGITGVIHYIYNHQGLSGPVLVHNLVHAFTGCVQRDIVSVRLGITDVFHYMYNHRVFGWARAVAQSRPCLHWLCTKGYCIGQVVCHRCYSLFTIIEGLAGPAPVHNLDHAFTGCVQRDIVSVRLGVTGVIHYIYNHRGFGWACSCISTIPSLVVYKRILYRSGWASWV